MTQKGGLVVSLIPVSERLRQLFTGSFFIWTTAWGGGSHFFQSTCSFGDISNKWPGTLSSWRLVFSSLFITFRTGVPTFGPWTGTSCQISGGIRWEIKCAVNVMSLNHPQTIHPSQPMQKLSFMKPVLGAKRLGTADLERLSFHLESSYLGQKFPNFSKGKLSFCSSLPPER